MTQAHREVEHKLRVPPGFQLPDLTTVVGVERVDEGPAFDMRNTYYDTPDLRLFRWGITLRRREGGPDEGWHLKLPVDAGLSRDEIRAPLGPDLPDGLRQLVTAFVRDGELGPIGTLRTRRTPRLLLDGDGVARAEVVDDTVAVLDGPRVRTTFREVEVEAIADTSGQLDVDFIDRIADHLLDLGAERGTMSKAGAALGPRAVAPPDVPDLPWPDPSDPAGDVVRAYLARHVRRLLLADVQWRRDLPDAVHQMRVSARRLRSGLKVFGSLVDASWAERLRDELGWMASALGEARDTEVLEARLDDRAGSLSPEDAALARETIDRALDARMRAAVGAAANALESPRYVALLVDLVDGVRHPPLTFVARDPADDVLPPLVRAAYRRLRKRVDGLAPDTPSADWHRARIAAKQARYATDAVAPVLGHRFEALAEDLAEVTDLLGHHQDSHVAQATLRDLVTVSAPEAAFALGQLLSLEEQSEMADRAAFRDLWPGVRRSAKRAGL